MRKVFWEDPYCTSLTTTVAQVNGTEVLLEQTIAYHFSGGQESDRSWLLIGADKTDRVDVLDSRMDGPLIFYQLPDDHLLKAGDEVIVQIDWQRRYQLMRLHFAAELVLEIVTKNWQLAKVGAHIAEQKARIDFVCDHNISQQFPEIIQEYSDIIASDLAIQTGYDDVEAQRRYWQIDGFAKVPCGGMHVKSTAEVGLIKLKRSNRGKNTERVEITLV